MFPQAILGCCRRAGARARRQSRVGQFDDNTAQRRVNEFAVPTPAHAGPRQTGWDCCPARAAEEAGGQAPLDRICPGEPEVRWPQGLSSNTADIAREPSNTITLY